MPTYDYYCPSCGFSEDIFHSIHKEALTECPQCKENTLKRGVHAPHISIVGEPTTIGSLGERNWEKKGRYEKDSIIEKDNLIQKQEILEERKKVHKINSMTKEQQKEYIEHGTI